jgi:preprotein translocase subunit SecG
MYLIDVKKLSQFGYANALAWVYFVLTVVFLGFTLFLFNAKSLFGKQKKAVLMRFEKRDVGRSHR